MRQLVLATRRQGYRGLLGRANGGMVVHLGIILIAVGARRVEQLHQAGRVHDGRRATPSSSPGTRSSWSTSSTSPTPRTVGIKALVSIDGGTGVRAGHQQVHGAGHGRRHAEREDRPHASDIYLTLENGSKPSTGVAKLKIFIKPMIVWLWVGGLLCGVGTLLAAFPGKHRRKPTDPVSAPVPLDEPRCRRRGAPPMSEGHHRLTGVDPAAVARRLAAAVAWRRSSRSAWRAVLVALFWVLASSSSGPTDKVGLIDSPLLGRPAPAVRSTTLDGTPFDLARRKGSWVVRQLLQLHVRAVPGRAPRAGEVRRAAGVVRRRGRRAVHGAADQRRRRTT